MKIEDPQAKQGGLDWSSCAIVYSEWIGNDGVCFEAFWGSKSYSKLIKCWPCICASRSDEDANRLNDFEFCDQYCY